MVSVRLDNPLPYGYWAGEQEDAIWVNYKYEKLPSAFCYDCGRIGHNNGACDFKEEYVLNRYGDHTRAGVNSPQAPTPKRPDGRPNREAVAASRTQQATRSPSNETVAVDPFWGNLQGSLTRENGKQQNNHSRRREAQWRGMATANPPGLERDVGCPGFARNLFADFNASADLAVMGKEQGGPSQTLLICNMSPWSPRQQSKKRKKGMGLIIREAQPEAENMETDVDREGEAPVPNYNSPYIPMEPVNQSCWRNHYGIEYGETSGYQGTNDERVVETRKPPEEK
ncbi:hypothetical protein LINGRAHAP2_LOCUS28942 [Linum grandiflorum]